VLLVDTNVLLAAADTSTTEHQRCAALLDERTDLAITTPVAAECSWMIESRLGPHAEAAFVTSIATGELAVIELTTTDWARCAELMTPTPTSGSASSTRQSSRSPNVSASPPSRR
jgi:predicted nucleic acid-binding protein